MSVVSCTQGIRDELAIRLAEVETDHTDEYTNWVNGFISDIQNTYPKAPFLQQSAVRTISAGTRIYTSLFPNDIGKINSLVCPQANVKLTYLDSYQFDILQPSASETGNPNFYTIRGKGSPEEKFEFYPTPGNSVNIQIDYQRIMPTVSAGSVTLGIPLRYYELPVLYGESIGLRRKGARTEAKEVRNEYEEAKQRMIEDLSKMTTEISVIENVRDYTKAGTDYGDPIRNIFNND